MPRKTTPTMRDTQPVLAAGTAMTIGNITIVRTKTLLCLRHEITGEGGSFNEEKLGKVLEQFYIDNF